MRGEWGRRERRERMGRMGNKAMDALYNTTQHNAAIIRGSNRLYDLYHSFSTLDQCKQGVMPCHVTSRHITSRRVRTSFLLCQFSRPSEHLYTIILDFSIAQLLYMIPSKRARYATTTPHHMYKTCRTLVWGRQKYTHKHTHMYVVSPHLPKSASPLDDNHDNDDAPFVATRSKRVVDDDEKIVFARAVSKPPTKSSTGYH